MTWSPSAAADVPDILTGDQFDDPVLAVVTSFGDGYLHFIGVGIGEHDGVRMVGLHPLAVGVIRQVDSEERTAIIGTALPSEFAGRDTDAPTAALP